MVTAPEMAVEMAMVVEMAMAPEMVKVSDLETAQVQVSAVS